MKPNILVAFDFSPIAEKALAWAADLVRSAGGSLRMIHVLNPIPFITSPEPIMPPMITDQDMLQVEGEMRAALTRNGLATETELVLQSNAGAAIVASAEQHGDDLIVMGTHGRGGWKRAALGSVADHVIRHAGCPVVTLREQGAPAS